MASRQAGGTAQLKRYWSTGAGATKIRWGTPGDFTRCDRQLRKHLGSRSKGYCARLHKARTGNWPGSRANRGTKARSRR